MTIDQCTWMKREIKKALVFRSYSSDAFGVVSDFRLWLIYGRFSFPSVGSGYQDVGNSVFSSVGKPRGDSRRECGIRNVVKPEDDHEQAWRYLQKTQYEEEARVSFLGGGEGTWPASNSFCVASCKFVWFGPSVSIRTGLVRPSTVTLPGRVWRWLLWLMLAVAGTPNPALCILILVSPRYWIPQYTAQSLYGVYRHTANYVRGKQINREVWLMTMNMTWALIPAQLKCIPRFLDVYCRYTMHLVCCRNIHLWRLCFSLRQNRPHQTSASQGKLLINNWQFSGITRQLRDWSALGSSWFHIAHECNSSDVFLRRTEESYINHRLPVCRRLYPDWLMRLTLCLSVNERLLDTISTS